MSPVPSSPESKDVFVGAGEFRYRVDANWAQLPAGYTWPEVSAVAIDSRDHVHVFNRGEHPVIVFDRDGNFLRSWGEGQFTRPHGITIGPDDCVYGVDDLGHCVRKFSSDGRLLMTLGTPGRPSDTGATSIDFRTIRHAGRPFHFPTNLAIGPNGELFIADGYGNCCIHCFTPNGEILWSWGAPGDGPGQFRVPHGIAVDRESRVWVADRENSRVQIFTIDGQFLGELRDLARPCQLTFDPGGNVYIAELGYRAGMWSGTEPPTPDATGGRLSIFSPTGQLLARWGGGENPTAPGDFFAPHDIRLDSRGDIYLAEVVLSAGGNRGLVDPTCHTLQKFTKVEVPPSA